MAKYADIIELLGSQKGRPIRYTVADGTAIPKGTVMHLSGDRTVTVSEGDDEFAGIAASEKVASDGQTTLALYTHGIFDMDVDESVITAGDHLDAADSGMLSVSDAAGRLKSGYVIALESSDETIQKIACLVGSGF